MFLFWCIFSPQNKELYSHCKKCNNLTCCCLFLNKKMLSQASTFNMEHFLLLMIACTVVWVVSCILFCVPNSHLNEHLMWCRSNLWCYISFTTLKMTELNISNPYNTLELNSSLLICSSLHYLFYLKVAIFHYAQT